MENLESRIKGKLLQIFSIGSAFINFRDDPGFNRIISYNLRQSEELLNTLEEIEFWFLLDFNISGEKKYELLRMIYECTYLIKLKKQQKVDSTIRQLNSIHLLHESLKPMRKIVKLNSSACCPECLAIDGKLLTMEDAIHQQIFPYVHCSNHSGCTCSYWIEDFRDAEGRLVFKSSFAK